MTTHTMKLVVDSGEMTYVKVQIVCSDNGGPGCAMGARADDCPDFLEAIRLYQPDEMGSWEASNGDWFDSVEEVMLEHLGADSCGWWWEGDHYHPAPGTGCYYVDWHSNIGDEIFELEEELELEVGRVRFKNVGTPEEPIFKVRKAS